jgi:CRISPR/Cas system CMR-associated protein Cmr5 small subunit
VKNLQQVRAAHAIDKAQALNKRVVNKIPALILTNGLLPAAAFTLGESRKEMRDAFDAIADFLWKRGPLAEPPGSDPGEPVASMIRQLSGKNSAELQRATAESLAYLGFLKRFAVKGGDLEN